MLTTYNKKEYKCFPESDRAVLLTSNEQVDSTWVGYKRGSSIRYEKMVLKSECGKFYNINCYGYYKGQAIEIINVEGNRVEVAGSAGVYTEEFVKTVLGGKRGRDLEVWCDSSIFSDFEMRYTENGEVTKIVKGVSLEQVREKVKRVFY